MEKPRGFFHVLRKGSGLYPFTAVLFFCGKGGKELSMDCFAMKDGNCSILRCGKCGGGTCHFHKTKEEQAQSLEKKDCGQSALVDAVKARIGGEGK